MYHKMAKRGGVWLRDVKLRIAITAPMELISLLGISILCTSYLRVVLYNRNVSD